MKKGYGKHFLALLAALVSLLITAVPAYAHIPCLCSNPPDQCTCFIQLGDKGLAVEKIIEKLKEKGYLGKTKKKSEFTQEVRQAVLRFQADHQLECTGWMDDETLDALLADVLPDEDEPHPFEYWDAICYVPTDGGKRYHFDPECSDMYNPRMISMINAESLGIEHCRRNGCTDTPKLCYSVLGLRPRILPDEYYCEDENEAGTTELLTRSLPSDDTETCYIGNRNTHVFHRATCRSAASMSDQNKVEFLSRDDAIDAGYKPCGKCHP